MKTLEIPIRRCSNCGAKMELEVFRPYDGNIKGPVDFYRLRWECPDCVYFAPVQVTIP